MLSTEILEEFSNITNNEAYLKAFCKRVLMPNQQGGTSDPYLGNNQRKEFIPSLRQFVQQLPQQPHIFDIGGGNGEIVELAIHQYAPKGTQLSVEEPHQDMLNDYIQRLEKYGMGKGEFFSCPIQDLYHRNLETPCDLILGIHMIYHLTDWRDANADPTADLKQFFRFLYEQLKPGGKLFIVYADQEKGFAGQVGVDYFRQHHSTQMANQLRALYRARNQLMLEGELLADLNHHYSFNQATLQQKVLPSRFYGQTIDDLAAMALVGEMIPSNDNPFDIEKVYCAKAFLERHGKQFSLMQEHEEGPREGMWGVNQPQVVCILTKQK
ncbi:class I SAM-dependent methyltransferase [Algicola sagamiensis]|uniref:class I SAM-dependent methyltransferase n=1 Tax=Algicola sagamiensis TaxID=163869 RepID=UPI0003774BAE|nr:methyltransferase domain-containing protein [Algicola sagamiensis]